MIFNIVRDVIAILVIGTISFAIIQELGLSEEEFFIYIVIHILLVLSAFFYLGPWIYLLIVTIITVFAARQSIRTRFYLSERAERAKRKGELRKALSLFARAGDTANVRTTLLTLPDLPVQALLIEAAEHLLELQSSAVLAQKTGVSNILTKEFTQQAQVALDALWGRVERIVSVTNQKVDSGIVKQLLKEEEQILQRLIQSAKKNREALAALTLSHDSREAIEDAERHLRAFGDVLGDLSVPY